MDKRLLIGVVLVAMILVAGCVKEEEKTPVMNESEIKQPQMENMTLPANVDLNNNKIADWFEEKLDSGTHKRVDDQADIIISFDRVPTESDVALIRKLGGEVYERWTVTPSIHASLPTPAIKVYISQNPNVVLVEENAESKALSTLDNSESVTKGGITR